jgi:hypothetical protein
MKQYLEVSEDVIVLIGCPVIMKYRIKTGDASLITWTRL